VADPRGAGKGFGSGRGAIKELVARARYERERACLDLTDAEQADVPSGNVRARQLYARAERHRRLAERLEAGDSSALGESRRLEKERDEG